MRKLRLETTSPFKARLKDLETRITFLTLPNASKMRNPSQQEFGERGTMVGISNEWEVHMDLAR